MPAAVVVAFGILGADLGLTRALVTALTGDLVDASGVAWSQVHGEA